MTTTTSTRSLDAPPPGARIAAIVRWLLIVGLAVAAVAAIGSGAGWFAHGAHEAASQDLYYCPMHPDVHSDHPGECPICHMTLVKAAAADAGPPVALSDASVPGLVAVDLSAERIQLAGLKTAPVTRARLDGEIRAVGAVTPSERGLAELQVRFAGWIQTLAVAETGQRVEKGQVVATVYSPELLGAQQEYLNALRWQADAAGSHTRSLADDARARLELLGMSNGDLDAIAQKGEPLRDVAIRAPLSGTVISRNVVAGAYIQPGASLLTIADLSTVWVQAEVYERDVGRVRVGGTATVTFPAYPGESFTGKVTFVAPTLDPETRTMRVRVEVANRDGRIRPGLYGEITLVGDSVEGLVVPIEAVVDTGEATYVFVAQPGGRFEPRRVQVGARVGDRVQLLAGVAEGELVVTTGNFLLDSESRLRASLRGATPTGHEGHGR